MSVRIAERRRSVRIPAAYPVTISNGRGRIITKGRTANISHQGLFVITGSRRDLVPGGTILLEISIPATDASVDRWSPSRTVRYVCRIARTQSIGQLLGLGLEFIEKSA